MKETEECRVFSFLDLMPTNALFMCSPEESLPSDKTTGCQEDGKNLGSLLSLSCSNNQNWRNPAIDYLF